MSESRGFREHCSRVVVALVLAALVWPSGARAQGTAIDEDIAVARALEGNPSLRAALIEHQRALRAIRGEEARYGFTLQLDGQLTIGDTPTLSRSAMGGLIVSTYSEQVALGAELERSFEWGMLATARLQGGRTFRRGIFVPGMDPISVGPGYTVDLVLTVTQPFLRGFGDRNGLAQLRALRVERDRTEASRVRQASSLVRDVRTAYWELWYARASLDVQRAALEVAQQHEADARARLELGGIAAADVLAFATRVASLTEAVVAAEADLARRSTELSRQLGGEAGIAVGSLEPGTEAPPAISPRAAPFMCAVGQYGLRGWTTSETPIASKLAPASSGRPAVADGGSPSPMTCEKLQPPRSKKSPSSISREMPPPPAGRSHESLRNGLPSKSSSPATMRACRSSSQALTAPASTASFIGPSGRYATTPPREDERRLRAVGRRRS